MSEPTQSNTEAYPIIVEWPNQPGGIRKVGRSSEAWQKMQNEAETAINQAMGTVRSMAYRISKTIETIDEKARPNEAEIEFGINLDVEAGALLAKTSAGAQLTVTLKWNVEAPERPQVTIKP